jgi:hypothetical protein
MCDKQTWITYTVSLKLSEIKCVKKYGNWTAKQHFGQPPKPGNY